MNIVTPKQGTICLIQQQGDRIVQIGLTTEQSNILQTFLVTLSKENPLIQMTEDYDLVLKDNLCKSCQLKSKI